MNYQIFFFLYPYILSYCSLAFYQLPTAFSFLLSLNVCVIIWK
jgi:hypothetical protein